MLFFREEELNILERFHNNPKHKACAVYGRRRTGKTELLLHYIREHTQEPCLYYQCTSYDYTACLKDFVAVLHTQFPGDTILDSLQTFKDVFMYLGKTTEKSMFIVIDEFPFLCKKNDNAAVEFQWIIDHALGNSRLVLLGSNLSFMKHQINDDNAPLYGRFDSIIEVLPFTFQEVHRLFPAFADAVDVYAQTGGVAQYVMFFADFPSVAEATDTLFLNKNGRLFQEAHNLLMQELRDVTTYVSILRVLSSSEKDSGQVAAGAGLDPRGVFTYLNKLVDLDILETVSNPLATKKNVRRYRIKDSLFRFSYTFIIPNVSMINALGAKSREYILNSQYNEYLGVIYEDIIRSSCYTFALQGELPFMPVTVGKWWGNIHDKDGWHESEVDLIAYDDENIIIGECKYRQKLVGKNELERLRAKVQFIPTKNRKVYCLLASKSGFTEAVRKEDVILIEQAQRLVSE